MNDMIKSEMNRIHDIKICRSTTEHIRTFFESMHASFEEVHTYDHLTELRLQMPLAGKGVDVSVVINGSCVYLRLTRKLTEGLTDRNALLSRLNDFNLLGAYSAGLRDDRQIELAGCIHYPEVIDSPQRFAEFFEAMTEHGLFWLDSALSREADAQEE